MFLYFIPQLWYDKTYIFQIRSKIILYLLIFVTFYIWLIPYIGWWGYVWEEFMIINIRDCFLNALLGHSLIVIIFSHSSTIPIFQAKISKTRKQNIEKYISPFPWLIINNLPNCSGEFLLLGILKSYADYIVAWRTFCIRKYLCIPIKYPAILVSFTLNIPMFLLWEYWDLDLNMEWGLWYIPEPKIL